MSRPKPPPAAAHVRLVAEVRKAMDRLLAALDKEDVPRLAR